MRQFTCPKAVTHPSTNRAQSRSPNMVPFDMLHMISYLCAIGKMSVRSTVFKIFDFKNAVTLKTGLRVRVGH